MASVLRECLASASRLFSVLRAYDRTKFLVDLKAGLAVGIMALPLAMAFGMASGVTPQQGITTGIVAGILIALFGGTRLGIGGPAAALVVIAHGIMESHGFETLVACTMLAGVFLVLMGLFKVGTLFKFIPYPVTAGLSSGIAVLLILGQVKEFFGLPRGSLPAGISEAIRGVGGVPGQMNPAAFALAGGSLIILRLWPRLRLGHVPGPIVVLVAGTAVAAVLQLPVATIGSQFGEIPAAFPTFGFPAFDLRMLADILQPAITIAILVAIESVLCAVVADGMTGDRHRADTGLIGQGIANLVAPLFGGLPAAGSSVQTTANIRAGAASPVSGIIHSATLLGIMLLAARWAGMVPLAVLSAIVVSVALRMLGWREFLLLRRIPPADGAAFLGTFLLTVVFDLTVAVPVGMFIAAMLYIKTMTAATVAAGGPSASEDGPPWIAIKDLPEDVAVYRVAAPHLFGAADKLEDALLEADVRPRVVILQLEAVTSMNLTALNALELLVSKITAQKGHVIFCGVHTQPYFLMARGGFLDGTGRSRVARDLDEALGIAGELLRR